MSSQIHFMAENTGGTQPFCFTFLAKTHNPSTQALSVTVYLRIFSQCCLRWLSFQRCSLISFVREKEIKSVKSNYGAFVSLFFSASTMVGRRRKRTTTMMMTRDVNVHLDRAPVWTGKIIRDTHHRSNAWHALPTDFLLVRRLNLRQRDNKAHLNRV